MGWGKLKSSFDVFNLKMLTAPSYLRSVVESDKYLRHRHV